MNLDSIILDITLTLLTAAIIIQFKVTQRSIETLRDGLQHANSELDVAIYRIGELKRLLESPRSIERHQTEEIDRLRAELSAKEEAYIRGGS